MSKIDVVVPYPIDEWPYFYPMGLTSTRSNFLGPDSEELYKRNLKNLSNNWIYRSKKIEYCFNSNSLRMKKDIKNVNESYILFSGTSYTFGVGINEEDRFSEKVSEKLNLDFINFSGPTFSNKLQIISFFNLLKKNFHLPKIIVLEYAPSDAYSFYSNGKFICTYKDWLKDPTYSDYQSLYKSLLKTDFFLQENNLYRNMLLSVCKSLGVKVLEFSFATNDKFIIENNILSIENVYTGKDINLEIARDVRSHNGIYTGHPGIEKHQQITNQLLNLI